MSELAMNLGANVIPLPTAARERVQQQRRAGRYPAFVTPIWKARTRRAVLAMKLESEARIAQISANLEAEMDMYPMGRISALYRMFKAEIDGGASHV